MVLNAQSLIMKHKGKQVEVWIKIDPIEIPTFCSRKDILLAKAFFFYCTAILGYYVGHIVV